jgi:hypothetical protein
LLGGNGDGGGDNCGGAAMGMRIKLWIACQGRPQYDPRLGDLVHTKKDTSTILELNKISTTNFFTLPELSEISDRKCYHKLRLFFDKVERLNADGYH